MDQRAPAKYKDRVPHVVEVDGKPMWYVDGAELGFAGGGGVIDREGGKGRALEALYEWTIDRIHVGAYDPKARIEVMDDSGIWAQVCFPNSIGLGGQGISDVVKDPELRLLCVQIYNDAMAEVQADSGSASCPCRCCRRGTWMPASPRRSGWPALDLRGVNITSDPKDVGAPDLANRAWDPLWEVCADLQLPVHFHIGASLTTMTYFGTYPWESQDEDTKLAIGGTLLFIGNARVVTNIILSGMLDRHPELKMVSVESGVGWIPFILEALDYEMSENAPKQLAHMSMLPSEYFRRNLYATFWFEKNNVPALIASVGEDNVLFETDFPAPDLPLPQAARHRGREDVDADAGGAAQDPGRERRQALPAVGPTTGSSVAPQRCGVRLVSAKSPCASSVECPTGDAVDTTVCQVPRSGRPVDTENHVFAELLPLCPPEKVTCSRTWTAGSARPSTSTVPVPITVEVPRMVTGPMARWSLVPVHATTARVPGHDVRRDGHDRGVAAEGRRVVDVEGDEVPVVVAGPRRALERTRAHAVVPALPVAVRVVEPEVEAPAGLARHRAWDPGPFGLGLGGDRDRLGSRAPVRVDAGGGARTCRVGPGLVPIALDRHARGQCVRPAVEPAVHECPGAGQDEQGDSPQHPAEPVPTPAGRLLLVVGSGRGGRRGGFGGFERSVGGRGHGKPLSPLSRLVERTGRAVGP